MGGGNLGTSKSLGGSRQLLRRVVPGGMERKRGRWYNDKHNRQHLAQYIERRCHRRYRRERIYAPLRSPQRRAALERRCHHLRFKHFRRGNRRVGIDPDARPDEL